MSKALSIRNVNPSSKWRAPRPSIFTYHDYRLFLRDWLAFLKIDQSDHSLRKLAKNADLSPSLLAMIIGGTRKLSLDALPRLGPVLKLDKVELSYFEILVSLGNATNQSHRTDAYRKLCAFRKFRDLNPKEFEVFKYLTHWYYVAIYEMSALPGFSDDVAWIQKRLRYDVDQKEITRAVEFLYQFGYLEKNPNGGTHRPPKAIECTGGIYKLALTQFHQEMFALASKSIESVESEDRNILGYTLQINEKNFQKIKKILDDAQSKIREIAIAPVENEKNEHHDVYHVQLALFPLTKKPCL